MPPTSVKCYDVLLLLQCSPDVVNKKHLVAVDHEPFMIVEAHDEGSVRIFDSVTLDKWYNAGDIIGENDCW